MYMGEFSEASELSVKIICMIDCWMVLTNYML